MIPATAQGVRAAFLASHAESNSDDEARAVTAAGLIKALAMSYTRGNGFDPDGHPLPDIAAVIVMATARLAANPNQVHQQVPVDGVDVPVAHDGGTVTEATVLANTGAFYGWSLAELAVLNRYRQRTL
jgi:hypothetical protein